MTIYYSSMAMPSAKSVATLFLHPACVGKPREFLLQRFDELIFHDGNPIFLTLPESDTAFLSSARPRQRPEQPARRFHNMHDAAAWIQQNWPDFDLEATHPVIWRGER